MYWYWYVVFILILILIQCWHNIVSLKVQSTGDTYMVASGVPRREDFHAELIATLALNLLHHAALFNMPEQLNRQLQLRIGINSGN